MAEWTQVSANRCFGGTQYIFKFKSIELKSTTSLGVYVPDTKKDEKLPLLLYLSGLTCTEKNFIEKAGAQRLASKFRVIVVNPDTSPRDVNIEGDKESQDIGEGAGFYLDATQEKWSAHYRMYSYIVKELVPLIAEKFPVNTNKQSIFGHSMGGHGALVIGLRNPEMFRSISSFAGICNPIESVWGGKAFETYLGADKQTWRDYDATELAKFYTGPKRSILLDQGLADSFYADGQLKPESLLVVKNDKLNIDFRKREKFDHSYFYITSFIEEHFNFHINVWAEKSD
ncbi:S-formylglutathione hydrolase [Aphelenchoides besseyi]|nr:S-formylglutathione hydrolase [Aphelenchoides besseyi]KAI6219983.1 S-formylglutathione hydrolase [Aphelenchoides besseyi]